MVLVAVFGVALLVAVLLSGLAARTVLSTSLLFLAGGALVSDGFLGLVHITALLVFGALLTPRLFGDLSPGGYAAVLLAIFLIRPASLLLSLLGTRVARKEKLVAAWFGPKGFASVVYGLLVLQSGIPRAKEAFTLIAVCIAFPIIAHSSTDVPIARAFDVEELAGVPGGGDAADTAPTTAAEAGGTAGGP